MHRFIAVICALFLSATSLLATERVQLGYGRIINNDFIGDGKDRWRTGSISSSRVRGLSWGGALPETFGEIIEYRLQGEIIAPDNLTNPAAGDRPLAGAWSLGVHTHFQRQGIELSTGADLVVTGSDTGLVDFQDALHDVLGVDRPSPAAKAAQIGNGVHPTLVMEAGQTFELGGSIRVRPFVEGRAGAETLLRAGADLVIGSVGQGELLVRDPVTGQRYRSVLNKQDGVSFVLGADFAVVEDSVYLPAPAYSLNDRTRVRAGMHWQGKGSSVFYGMTWLDEEFSGQSEGQLIGSLRLNIEF